MWKENRTMPDSDGRLERLDNHLAEIHGDLDLSTCTRCGEQVNYTIDFERTALDGRLELVRRCHCTVSKLDEPGLGIELQPGRRGLAETIATSLCEVRRHQPPASAARTAVNHAIQRLRQHEDAFDGVVDHELDYPNGIAATMQILRRELSKTDPPHLTRPIHSIHDAIAALRQQLAAFEKELSND